MRQSEDLASSASYDEDTVSGLGDAVVGAVETDYDRLVSDAVESVDLIKAVLNQA